MLVKQATWGEGRLEVALKPPFDVILREVQKVRAAEKVGDGGTRTPPKPQHSNSPGGPNPSTPAPSEENVSAEIAKWREKRDSNSPGSRPAPCRGPGLSRTSWSTTQAIAEIDVRWGSGTRAGDPCLPLSGCRWYGPRQRRVGGDSSPWRTRKAVQSYWLVRGRSHLSEGVCSVPPYSASSTAGTRRLTPYPGSRPLTRAVLRLHGNRWRAAGRCNWRAVHSSRIHSRDRWL